MKKQGKLNVIGVVEIYIQKKKTILNENKMCGYPPHFAIYEAFNVHYIIFPNHSSLWYLIDNTCVLL